MLQLMPIAQLEKLNFKEDESHVWVGSGRARAQSEACHMQTLPGAT